MSGNMRKDLSSLFIRKTEESCKAAKNAIAVCESKRDSLTTTPQLAEILELLRRSLGQARVILSNQASYFQCLRCTENARQIQDVITGIAELSALETKREELETELTKLSRSVGSQTQSKKSLERTAKASVGEIPCPSVDWTPLMLIIGYFAVIAYMHNTHVGAIGFSDWLAAIFWPVITLVVLPFLLFGGDGEAIWNAVSLFLIAFSFPVAYLALMLFCSGVNESRADRKREAERRYQEHVEHTNATAHKKTSMESRLDSIRRQYSEKRKGIVQELEQIQW